MTETSAQMAKFLLITPEKCTGCRTCELACSFKHEEVFNPVQARLTVLTYEQSGLSIPKMCIQCTDPECQKACPADAISRSEETGALLIDDDLCIKCLACIDACPYGGVAYDSVKEHVIKCDLCEGEPQCAKLCPSGAITYCEAAEDNSTVRTAIAEQFKQITEEGLQCTPGQDKSCG